MKKVLLFFCLLLPIAVVKAQTFQRKAQQPAFFMPKSALTNQQPEQLPAVENMNYQGRRPMSRDLSPKIEADRTASNEKPTVVNHLLQQQNEAKPKPSPKLIEPQQITKQEEQKPQQLAPAQAQKEKSSSKSTDDYQKTFADILQQHHDDLLKISNGKYTQNPDIEALIESYKPKTETIKNKIFPRAIISQ